MMYSLEMSHVCHPVIATLKMDFVIKYSRNILFKKYNILIKLKLFKGSWSVIPSLSDIDWILTSGNKPNQEGAPTVDHT